MKGNQKPPPTTTTPTPPPPKTTSTTSSTTTTIKTTTRTRTDSPTTAARRQGRPGSGPGPGPTKPRQILLFDNSYISRCRHMHHSSRGLSDQYNMQEIRGLSSAQHQHSTAQHVMDSRHAPRNCKHTLHAQHSTMAWMGTSTYTEQARAVKKQRRGGTVTHLDSVVDKRWSPSTASTRSFGRSP